MITLANNILAYGGSIVPLHITDVEELKNRGISNPSIVKHNGKNLVCFRSCDYTFFMSNRPLLSEHKLMWYPIDQPSAHTKFNSRNVICEMDENCKLLNPKMFMTETGDNKFNGYEDIRLSSYNGTLYASASHPNGNSIPIRICKLNSEYEIESYDEYGGEGAIEKNWMPVLDREGVFVYLAPERVVKAENGALTDIRNEKGLETFRGSSQLVPYTLNGRDGYVCIVHRSVIERSDAFYVINYYHKFLFFDKDFSLINVSDWFKFAGMPVEFTCGLMIEDGIVTLPFSLMDSYPVVAKFGTELIDDILLRRYKTVECDCNINNKIGDITRKICECAIEDGTDNYAAKIAMSTYLAANAKNREEAVGMYEHTLEILKYFNNGQSNWYLHQLLFQDQIIEQIKILKS